MANIDSTRVRYSEEDFNKQALELWNLVTTQYRAQGMQTVIDTLHDIYNDGKKYGAAKALEDITRDLEGLISDYEEYDVED